MNTTELEKCLHILSFYKNQDESVITTMQSLKIDIEEDYLTPFTKEFNKNLLSNDTFEAKRNLIVYYIFEFWELQLFYKNNKALLLGVPREWMHIDEDKLTFRWVTEGGVVLSAFESYVLSSEDLFNKIFVEIQLCCLKYKIDFISLCNELLFSTEYINISTTLAFNEILSRKSEQPEIEPEQENNFLHSTIEDWLFEFKEQMTEFDYNSLVSALIHYFDNGVFPELRKPIQINGRPNKKLLGWALNRIFEAHGKSVEKELLIFAKQNISLFADVKFDESDILRSNLYKYFTTKTR